jgi:hypothetical protein
MKQSLIALALLVSFGAMAQEATATSQAGSASQAGAASQSGAVIYLDQSGPSSQTVNATTNVNGNSTYTGSTTAKEDTSVHYSGTQTVKNVPGIAMSGPASGPCTGSSGGLGVAGPGFGVGLNGAKVEPSCVLRENIRVTGMAMQSLDGATNPQEKGALLVMMMDQMRGLAAMSAEIINDNVKAK